MSKDDTPDAARLERLRLSAADDPDIPERVRGFLLGGAALEEIRLDARGRWWHEGERFVNRRLSDLFHRSLQRTAGGTWVLSIPPYTYPVLVDGTGRFVDSLDVDAEGRLVAGLMGGSQATPGMGDFRTDGESLVVVALAEGTWARLVGDAYRRVLDGLEGDAESWRTRIGPCTIALQPLPNPLPDELAAARDC